MIRGLLGSVVGTAIALGISYALYRCGIHLPSPVGFLLGATFSLSGYWLAQWRQS